MQRLSKAISKSGYNLCAAYCSDATYLTEPTKYIATCLTSVSAMVQMNLPHLNVLTKCDKVTNTSLIEQAAESTSCADFISKQMDSRNFFNKKFYLLNQRIVDVVDNYASVNYQELNI
jgi:GTP-binding protein EngB required for normal cell division